MNITDYAKSPRSILGNQASANYQEHLSKIDQVRNGIYHNRKGQIPLSEITKDQDKLRKRIAREGFGLDTKSALERINGVPNFQDVAIIKKLARNSLSICRVCIRNSYGPSGYGTGFLIAPEILITNNHVLPDPETAKYSLAQFNYEIDESGRMLDPVSFKLNPEKFFLTSTYEPINDDPLSGLDFTLVAVDSLSDDSIPLEQFGFIRLDCNLGKIIEGENCVVIQHPNGDYKKVVLKDIRMITLTDNCLIYESDTLPGSSGSVVIGLGTGEVVALHHSSIPRLDSDGNWLRRDGSMVQPNDSDDMIDWIGNEGIRVSRIIDVIKKYPLSENMNAFKTRILTLSQPQPSKSVVSANMGSPHEEKQSTDKINNMEPLRYFEILLADHPQFIEDWENRSGELIKNLQSCVPLLPSSADPYNKRLFYLTVQSAKNPWLLASEIESLPHIEECIPDLQTITDIGISEENRSNVTGVESNLITKREDPWNEPEFLSKWGQSVSVKEAKKTGADYYRWWNWIAIRCPQDSIRAKDPKWKNITENLGKLRFVQLDTGYSRHSKVFEGWDLNQDYDFIDTDENAEDIMEGGLLRHAGHGTRTASIVVGNEIKAALGNVDGNGGLLTIGQNHYSKLIPYRIAKSVILIGRGKELMDAVKYAIRNNSDVMFMCMGSYPRPMFEAISKEAYYNGIIWVCAAGNEVELVVAPAMYPGTLAVAAINPDDKPWRGSSNGKSVDIAAPGEDVYVPVFDNNGKESMNYGSGTSYATPHVAAAAMLWKAKNLYDISVKYIYPWQIVEAFRYCVKKTARKPYKNWNTYYGEGILDLNTLLNEPLPDAKLLKDAYEGEKDPQYKDPGIREAAHYIWNVIMRKIKPGSTESLSEFELTDRGKQALEAFAKPSGLLKTESTRAANEVNMKSFIRDYFEQND